MNLWNISRFGVPLALVLWIAIIGGCQTLTAPQPQEGLEPPPVATITLWRKAF